jgi:chromosomal replication initiation ATPase DnaA
MNEQEFTTRIDEIRAELEKIDERKKQLTDLLDNIERRTIESFGAYNWKPQNMPMLSALEAADNIVRQVARYYNITPIELKSRNRKREFCYPRQVAHRIVLEFFSTNRLIDGSGEFISTHGSLSLKQVGELTGQDHATVLHSVKTINNLIETDRQFSERFLYVRNEMQRILRESIIEKI